VQKWGESIATGEPFERAVRVRRADGVYRRMLHRKVPRRDVDGTVIQWFGSSVDIEERKRAEEELRTTAQLSQRKRVLSVRSATSWPCGQLGFRACEEVRLWALASPSQDLSSKPTAGGSGRRAILTTAAPLSMSHCPCRQNVRFASASSNALRP